MLTHRLWLYYTQELRSRINTEADFVSRKGGLFSELFFRLPTLSIIEADLEVAA